MTFYIGSSTDVKNTPITSIKNTIDVKEHLKRVKKRYTTSVISYNRCNKILLHRL